MKKPMDQLKEIMGVPEEQPIPKGSSKEIQEIKRQLKELLKVIKIIEVIAILFTIASLMDCIGTAVEHVGMPSPEAAEKIYKSIKYAFISAVIFYITMICSRFCRDIYKSNTPFIPQVSKGLKKIAIAIVFMVLLLVFGDILYSHITDTKMEGTISWLSMAFVSILLLLSAIFDYGCKLQKESDETI